MPKYYCEDDIFTCDFMGEDDALCALDTDNGLDDCLVCDLEIDCCMEY